MELYYFELYILNVHCKWTATI